MSFQRAKDVNKISLELSCSEIFSVWTGNKYVFLDFFPSILLLLLCHVFANKSQACKIQYIYIYIYMEHCSRNSETYIVGKHNFTLFFPMVTHQVARGTLYLNLVYNLYFLMEQEARFLLPQSHHGILPFNYDTSDVPIREASGFTLNQISITRCEMKLSLHLALLRSCIIIGRVHRVIDVYMSF